MSPNKTIQVCRFHNSVAIIANDGTTQYLMPGQALDVARALTTAAKDIDACAINASTLAPFTSPVGLVNF